MKAKSLVFLALTLCLTFGLWAQDNAAQSDVVTEASADAGTESAQSPDGDSSDEIIPSIIFDETPITDVITTLARQAEINFVFAPEVTAPQVGPDGTELPPTLVTFRFENVTAENALTAVLENHNLELIPNTKTGIARIVVKDPNRLEPLITKILQLEHASPTNVVQAIEASISERGKVVPDFRTSQVVIIATEKEFEGIDNLIDKLDIATPQVLIEARIMETSINPTSIKGIDWSGTLANQNFSFGNGLTTGASTRSAPGASSTTTRVLPTGTTITETSNAPSATTSTYTSTLGNAQLAGVQPLGVTANMLSGFSPQTAFLNADGVRGVLSFLNTDSDTKVVATPRQVTLDNHTATLAVTRAFPIFQITPGSANSPAGAQVTYTNLGTILEVTPRISANSNIHLTVIPEVSNVDSKDTQVINGEVNEANVYAIRRMETQVIIPNGNTLVMGGLMNDNRTTANNKVPVLGDLPGLGLLFRRDTKMVDKINLIIFITPTIVEDYDYQYTPSDYLRNSLEPSGAPVNWKEPEEPSLSPWDRGKPMSWGRSSK